MLHPQIVPKKALLSSQVPPCGRPLRSSSDPRLSLNFLPCLRFQTLKLPFLTKCSSRLFNFLSIPRYKYMLFWMEFISARQVLWHGANCLASRRPFSWLNICKITCLVTVGIQKDLGKGSCMVSLPRIESKMVTLIIAPYHQNFFNSHLQKIWTNHNVP